MSSTISCKLQIVVVVSTPGSTLLMPSSWCMFRTPTIKQRSSPGDTRSQGKSISVLRTLRGTISCSKNALCRGTCRFVTSAVSCFQALSTRVICGTAPRSSDTPCVKKHDFLFHPCYTCVLLPKTRAHRPGGKPCVPAGSPSALQCTTILTSSPALDAVHVSDGAPLAGQGGHHPQVSCGGQ